AWKAYQEPIKAELEQACTLLSSLGSEAATNACKNLEGTKEPLRRDIYAAVKEVLREHAGDESAERSELSSWILNRHEENLERYGSHLYSQSELNVKNITDEPLQFEGEKLVDGREVLRDNFDAIL